MQQIYDYCGKVQNSLPTSPQKCYYAVLTIQILIITILLTPQQVQTQQTSDGYPTQFTQYRTMRKQDGSFIRFQNKIDTQSEYLTSYSFEMYLKFQAYNVTNSQNQSVLANYTATILDCFPYVQVNITHQKITYTQFNGETMEYVFNTTSKEFENDYLLNNQWVHLTFSYNNYSTSTNMMMYMRYHYNGELKMSKRVNSPGKSSDLNIGKGLCFFGNTRHNAQMFVNNSPNYNPNITLNADVSFLVINDAARQVNNFKSQIFHMYPNISDKTLLYFKFDALDGIGQDYYYNRSVTNFMMVGMPIVQDENKTGICECYGKPMNVYKMQRSRDRISSSAIIIKDTDQIVNAFVLDFWILIQDDLELPTTSSRPMRQIFFADKFVKVGTTNKDIMVSIGDTSQYSSVSNVLYYRKWIYIGIQLKTTRQVGVFKNGIKAATIGQQGTIKQSNTQFLVRHEITMKMWKFRLLNSGSNSLNDTFFLNNYLQGSNSGYNDKINLQLSYIIFDFKLEDTEFSSYTYSSQNLVDGSIDYTNQFGNTYRWTFSAGEFQPDSLTCGDTPIWIDGICQDNRWYPYFKQDQIYQPSFQRDIQSLSNEMTIELWFKPFINNKTNHGCLMSIIDPLTKKDKFRIDGKYSQSSQTMNLTVGSYDLGSQQLSFINQVKVNQWYHLTWQTNSIVPIQRALLFDLELFEQLIQDQLSRNISLSQLNTSASVTQQQNTGILDVVIRAIATTTIGNTYQGGSPYLGFLRELRIWYEYRKDSMIERFRNLELPGQSSFRKNLAFYYRMVGQDNVVNLTNVGSQQNSDLVISGMKSIQSPMRFQQDTDLLICPFGGYLSNDAKTCNFPSQPQINIISYIDVNSNKGTLDSQAMFKQNDQKYFNITYMLFSTVPYDQQHMSYVQSQFNQKDQTKIEIVMNQLSQKFNYSVQLRVTNTIYQNDFDQYYYKWFDPTCPSFNFPLINPNDGQLYIFKKQGQTTTIVLTNRTYCLFELYYNRSLMVYNWTFAQNNLNNANVINQISFNQSGQNIIMRQNDDIPNESIVKFNITLRYNNTFIQQAQLYQQLLNVVITNRSINIIFENSQIYVFNGSNLIINTTRSFIINPDYNGRTIVYRSVCPEKVFKSALDYNQTCVFTQTQKAMLITASSYQTRMNLVQYLPYTFTIQAYIDGYPNTLTEQNLTVTWVKLTPSNIPCPAINMPTEMSISNKVNQTIVLPEYLLTCSNYDTTVSYYNMIAIEWQMESSHVSFFYGDTWKQYVMEQWNEQHSNSNNNANVETSYEYMVFDNYLRQQLFLDFQDQNYWLYITNIATKRMKIDEYFTLEAKFQINRTDLAQPITIRKQIKFTQISSELIVIIETNKDDYRYSYTDDIIINLSKSYDPEDRNTPLRVTWLCPKNSSGQTVSFCPTDGRTALNITLEQRIQAGWQYEMNHTFSLTIYNPLTNKFDDQVRVNIYLIFPNLNESVICPSFDFSKTNAGMWSSNTNTSQLLFTNNVTNEYKFSMPSITLNCNSTTQNTYVAFQLYDPQSQIIPRPQSYSVYNFPTTSTQLTFTNAMIRSLTSGTTYNITCLLWYRQRYQLNLTLATHLIQLRRIQPDDKLIAVFNQSLYTVIPTGQITMDASLSYDNLNISNKNFSYNWTCPDSIKNVGYCPKYYDSTFIVTALLRNAAQINVPGRLHRFGVQIYDNIRLSSMAQTLLFIQPDSPNKDCLMTQFNNPTLATIINTNFMYPLIVQLKTTTYCSDLVITENKHYIQNDQQNIYVKSFIGYDKNLVQIPYLNSITTQQSYTITYRQTFSVMNDYSNQQNITHQIQMIPVAQNQYSQTLSDFYITSQSIINLEQQTQGLTLQLQTQNPTLNLNQMIVKWLCDPMLYAQTVCNNTVGSNLNIKFSDIGYYNYKTYVEGKIYQFQAQITNPQQPQNIQYTSYNMYFTQLSDNSFPKTCNIQTNMIGNLNITKQIIFSLVCDSQQYKFLDTLNVQYQWSIQNQGIDEGIINQTDKTRILRLKPFTLQQNRIYLVNLTITYPDYTSKLLYIQQYNTSQNNIQPILQVNTNGYQLTPSFGYFFQTLFNISFNYDGFGTNNTNLFNGSLNIFYQLRIYDGSYWYCLLPFQIMNKNITNLTLPIFTKIVLDISNNLGQITQLQFPSTYQIYNDQNIQDLTLLTLIQNRTNQYSLQNTYTQNTVVNTQTINPLQYKINDMYQYMQIISRMKLKSSLTQAQVIAHVQYLIGVIENVQNYLSNNSDIYCYVSPLCVRIKQNVLLILFQAYLQMKEYAIGTDEQMSKIRDQVLFFTDDLEILSTDLNQNLANCIENILNKVPSNNQNVGSYSRIYELIRVYRIQSIAPGESNNNGNDGNNTTGVYKLNLNENFTYTTNDLQIFIPVAIVNNLTYSNMPNIPLAIQIKTLQNLKQDQNISYLTNIIADIQILDSIGQQVKVKNLNEQIVVRFNSFYDYTLQPTNSYVNRTMCVYKQNDNDYWQYDGLNTQMQTIDNINRTFCYSNHLTQFTVILQKTPQLEQSIIQPQDIEYFYDQHWDKYLIAIIIIVMLFLCTSALSCYHHIQMFKKPKNLEELHNQQIMTSENLVIIEGELRYKYRLISGFRMVQSLFMINSILGIILQHIKFLSLALRTQIFFGQILLFAVVGGILFRFKTHYSFIIINDGKLIDGIVLPIIVYVLMLIPLSLLTNLLYRYFKPELFKLKSESSQQSSHSQTYEQYNTHVNQQNQEANNYTSNRNNSNQKLKKSKQTQNDEGPQDPINKSQKHYRQNTNFSDSQAIKSLQDTHNNINQVHNTTEQQQQQQQYLEERDQMFQYSGGESETEQNGNKQDNNTHIDNLQSVINNKTINQIHNQQDQEYEEDDSEMINQQDYTNDLIDDSIQDGINTFDLQEKFTLKSSRKIYLEDLQNSPREQIEEVKETFSDQDRSRIVNDTNISQNLNTEMRKYEEMKSSKFSIKNKTTHNPKYVTISQDEENKFYTFRQHKTNNGEDENVPQSSSHKHKLSFIPNSNQRIKKQSDIKLMESVGKLQSKQTTGVKTQHLNTPHKRLMTETNQINLQKMVSPQNTYDKYIHNTQQNKHFSNQYDSILNIDEVEIRFEGDINGPMTQQPQNTQFNFKNNNLKYKSTFSQTNKPGDLLKKSQLTQIDNNNLIKSQAVFKLKNQILIDGESPNMRLATHAELDSMEDSEDIEYIQDDTMRSYDNNNQGNNNRLLNDSYNKRKFVLKSSHGIVSEKSRKYTDQNHVNIDEIYIDVEDINNNNNSNDPQILSRQSKTVKKSFDLNQISKEDNNETNKYIQKRDKYISTYNKTILAIFIINCLLLAITLYLGTLMNNINLASFVIYMAMLLVVGSFNSLIKAIVIKKYLLLDHNQVKFNTKIINRNCLIKLYFKVVIGSEIQSFILYVIKHKCVKKDVIDPQQLIDNDFDIINQDYEEEKFDENNQNNTKQENLRDMESNRQRLTSMSQLEHEAMANNTLRRQNKKQNNNLHNKFEKIIKQEISMNTPSKLVISKQKIKQISKS